MVWLMIAIPLVSATERTLCVRTLEFIFQPELGDPVRVELIASGGAAYSTSSGRADELAILVVTDDGKDLHKTIETRHVMNSERLEEVFAGLLAAPQISDNDRAITDVDVLAAIASILVLRPDYYASRYTVLSPSNRAGARVTMQCCGMIDESRVAAWAIALAVLGWFAVLGLGQVFIVSHFRRRRREVVHAQREIARAMQLWYPSNIIT